MKVDKLNLLFVMVFLSTFLNVLLYLNAPQPTQTVIKQIGQAGSNGTDGKNGVNGRDSFSTLKVIQTDHTVIQQIPVNGKDGYTPIKGLDYVDGTNGRDGKDGESGATPEVRVEGCQFQTKFPSDDEWNNRGNVCGGQQ